ncbi:hypothetical protein DWU98_03495 [Dyella monticola]|uniref:Uncharacterized protein n=1 Tax=Dyella monticola TaxID=1927958 RepID=A0A370X9D1_9GAMM|nr:hypothetical protein DWU98_03495 [Dyella monticola]
MATIASPAHVQPDAWKSLIQERNYAHACSSMFCTFAISGSLRLSPVEVIRAEDLRSPA